MRSYTEVKTRSGMEELLNSTTDFHDSMSKELHIINRGYVADDHAMVCSHRFDCHLLIQSQSKPYGIELVFFNVAELDLSDPQEYGGAEGDVGELTDGKREVDMRFDATLRVRAERLYYRVRDDWLGPRARLTGEVPAPDAVLAKRVEGRWRQCTSCRDAWEEDLHSAFSLCTGCGKLTELAG